MLKFLFSFKGRINRAKFWLVLIAPGGLIIIGLLIGGILVAQSMIATAKLQKFCRETTTAGTFTGDCQEIHYLYTQYKLSNISTKQVDQLAARNLCETEKEAGNYTGSCDEFVNLLPDMQLQVGAVKAQEAGSSGDKETSEAIMTGGFIGIIFVILLIPVWWAWFAITAKRLHDRNLSGWWQALPAAIKITGMVATLVISATVGGLLTLIGSLIGLIIFIICGFVKGTDGPNRFGPDPLDKNKTQI